MPRLARSAFSVLIGLLVLEGLLHVYNPLPMRVRGDRIVLPVHETYRFHNEGADKLDPLVVHTKNALGFRGPDPPADFAERLTIVTVGGSTTECLFLSDGQTWTDELARRAGAAIPGAWVNNGGLDGHSTFGHLALLRTFLAGLRPSVIVYLIGTNDVGLEDSSTFDAGIRPSGSRLRAAVAGLADHVELVALAINVVRAARARDRGFGHSEVDLRAAPRLALDEDVMDRTASQVARLLPAYEGRVRALVLESRAAGIEPVLVTQPALFGDAVDPVTGVDLAEVKVNGRGNGHLEWRLLEMYNDVTRRVAAATGTTLVDLAREMPKDSRLYYDFLHYTNEGARVVGDIVADGILPALEARAAGLGRP